MRFNPVSALAAGIAYYAVQAIWYMALGKAWQAASGAVPDGSYAPLIWAFVIALIIGFVVETALHATTDPNPPMHGIKFGLFFGIGLFTTNLFEIHQFEQRPLALTIIDGLAVPLCLAVAGLVVGLFHRNNAKVA